ncbi:CBS domain-containing protein [Ferruginibacter albus]|uniref:CBS domain-containing protein n=1 Tax=Ferruginibacter albus TaxID=2875540 RepID=UPI001CC724AB|nr:CBS domain-containing protein [Ferruginibacter albus]UAY50831.1 CBS domain-containing protein [Ferruginibacter albus]
MTTVKNILDSKQKVFNIVPSDTLVYDALVQLNSVNLSYLVVMDGEEYKGIFGERDYTRNVILKGRASNSTMVKEVMTTDLPVVTLTDTAEHCMHLMNAHKARYLLVYDEKMRFIGIVTIHDILRQVIANREQVFDSSLTNALLDTDEYSGVL